MELLLFLERASRQFASKSNLTGEASDHRLRKQGRRKRRKETKREEVQRKDVGSKERKMKKQTGRRQKERKDERSAASLR